MRFAHIADCHIGSWREPKLNNISTDAFIKAIDISKEKDVDFIIIAGDLFNTPLPAIDKLKTVVQKLRELKEKNIPVYGIPGSHDFSPSGKTMIDVLESAGLFTNVCKGSINENGKLTLKYTQDPKTKILLTGIIGKKGMKDLAEAGKNGTLFGSLAHRHGAPAAIMEAIYDVVTAHFNGEYGDEKAVQELANAVAAVR